MHTASTINVNTRIGVGDVSNPIGVIWIYGNIEGKDVPAGAADVVVTDGFSGNVFLKTAEGTARLLLGAIKEGVQRYPVARLGALLMRPALVSASRKLDYREFGGATLLGVDGVVVIGHGRSDAYAVRNAIRLAVQAVERDVVGAIKNGLDKIHTHETS